MKRLLCALALPFALSGCDISFGRVEALWLLWLLPALIGFFIFAASRRQRLLERLVAAPLADQLARGTSRARRRLRAALLVVAVAALVLALAEPRLGFTWEEVRQRGTDLVIAVDVSDSMLVEDAAAGDHLDRLLRAKRKIADLLGMLDGDRVAIEAFAGAAYIECPLTADYAAAAQFVEALDTDSISSKGTALGDAIRTALKALAGGNHESQAIILITDGEDTTGEAESAAAEAAKAGVSIFTMGIGRTDGSPIPQADGSLRRDRRGELVLSKLDESTLQRIALSTGGTYVHSVTGDLDLESIYRQGIKQKLSDRDFESRHRQRWHERHPWLVALAALALVAELLLPDARRRMA
jgi:Ca-activated chloride channel homolog